MSDKHNCCCGDGRVCPSHGAPKVEAASSLARPNGYGPEFLESDHSALASAADEIAFARHHLNEHEWDEVEECIRRANDTLEEIHRRMFEIRHGLLPTTVGNNYESECHTPEMLMALEEPSESAPNGESSNPARSEKD